VPVVDVSALFDRPSPAGATAAAAIDRACRDVGFFGLTGHGVDPDLLSRLDEASRRFFSSSEHDKDQIAMRHAGVAWRGWFPVGSELTSGVADAKEGIYFGTEHRADDPRVLAGVALHGPNQFPGDVPELRTAVLDWLGEMRRIAEAVLRAMAVALGLAADWFERHLTGDPTVLFRIFHYPPSSDPDRWGVGEHTDYGLITLLAQDGHGGLEVRRRDGGWIEVDPDPYVIVCNLGDMLERLTAGRYRSTPHRVRNVSGSSRLSFPYFFDPSWDARVDELPGVAAGDGERPPRWDGADVRAFEGTYGDYLTAKVAKVFPELFAPTPQRQ
jgi:isopenicillin N synthase-like dioxygenase